MFSALWTVRDIARVTLKTETSVYQAVRDQLFPPGVVIHIGRLIRFHPERFVAWLEGGGSQWPGGWRRETPNAVKTSSDR